MLSKTSSFLLGPALVCCLLMSGCGAGASHPGQIDAFDGAAYDSLTLAHGALTSLRAQIAVSYPRYDSTFDEAAASYAAAYSAYALYRAQAGSEADVSALLANLTVSIIALENVFESDMKVSPGEIQAIRGRAQLLRRRAVRSGISASDILTELEIAAAVARAIPAASQYALLASMVIDATSQALAAEISAAGQPIDLSAIQPIQAIQFATGYAFK